MGVKKPTTHKPVVPAKAGTSHPLTLSLSKGPPLR